MIGDNQFSGVELPPILACYADLSIQCNVRSTEMIENVPGTRTASTAYQKKRRGDVALPKTEQTQLVIRFDPTQKS